MNSIFLYLTIIIHSLLFKQLYFFSPPFFFFFFSLLFFFFLSQLSSSLIVWRHHRFWWRHFLFAKEVSWAGGGVVDVVWFIDGARRAELAGGGVVDVVWFIDGARWAESTGGGVVDGVSFFDGIWLYWRELGVFSDTSTQEELSWVLLARVPPLGKSQRERVKAKEELGKMAGFVNKTAMKIDQKKKNKKQIFEK